MKVIFGLLALLLKFFMIIKRIGIWQLGEEAQAKAFGGFKPGDIKVADMSPKGSEGEGRFLYG